MRTSGGSPRPPTTLLHHPILNRRRPEGTPRPIPAKLVHQAQDVLVDRSP
jgi:hypothetical protein